MHVKEAYFLAMILCHGFWQTASTPNLQDIYGAPIMPKNGIGRAKPLGRPKLSNNASSPSLVANSFIENYDDVLSRHRSMVQRTYDLQVKTYLNIMLEQYSPDGCVEKIRHPTGVQRTLDGLLNGQFILLACDGFWIELSVSDLSQVTYPAMNVDLSNRYSLTYGGYLLNSYGVAENGKVRQHGSFLKTPLFASYTAQSFDKYSIDKMKESLDVMARLISSKPPQF